MEVIHRALAGARLLDIKAEKYHHGTPKSRELHGMAKSAEYKIWSGIIQRCTNPKRECYDRYGGDGVTICDEWRESFVAFYKHIGPRPSKNHTLDRIKNSLGYEPGNVRWATRIEQANNTSRLVLLTAFGKTQTQTKWSIETGLPLGTIRSRLKRGMKLEDILTMAPMGVPAGYKGLKRFESEYTNKCTKEITMKCVNCERRFENDNGVCKSCGHTICAECLATARRRIAHRPTYGHCGTKVDPDRKIMEYLCNPCCVRQDAIAKDLRAELHPIFHQLLYPETYWAADTINDMESALERAKEAL